MAADEVALRTRLSCEECWNRINTAQSEGSAKIVGYALGSIAGVVANGDQFELRHSEEPAVFTGIVNANETGSLITGRIGVPVRGLYAATVIGTLTIGVLLLGTSAWDLVFGTRHLLTRKATELGPGHPANFEQHIAVFIIVPIIVAAVLAIFGEKARRPSAEAQQGLVDFLHAMFASDGRG